MSTNTTFDKASVLEAFIEEVDSYLPQIQTNLERLIQSPGDMDALDETYRRTHTIGGSASMMDFAGLAHVAHGMEDVLADALDGLVAVNDATLGLLQRSFERLVLLLSGIHGSVDEEAVIAQDDNDYARWRAMQTGADSGEIPVPDVNQDLPPFGRLPSIVEGGLCANSPSEPVSSIPETSSPLSFDEVLASFRTPSTRPGEEVAWPEDPVFPSVITDTPPALANEARLEMANPGYSLEGYHGYNSLSRREDNDFVSAGWMSDSKRDQDRDHGDEMTQTLSLEAIQAGLAQKREQAKTESYRPTAFDELMAGAQMSSPPQEYVSHDSSVSALIEPPSRDRSDESSIGWWKDPKREHRPPVTLPVVPEDPFLNVEVSEEYSPHVPTTKQLVQNDIQATSAGLALEGEQLSQIYDHMRKDAEKVVSYTETLGDVTTQLHEAMEIIESQRSEFKGFLDGSPDALERMEDWAGKAMGLDLRRSPEQVRRYLPLSVMWVANVRLRKVFDLLMKIGVGWEMADGQITSNLHELYDSIQSFGSLYQQWEQNQAQPTQSLPTGWSPWEMTHEAGNALERVTFERQGDIPALRAELEQQIRSEVRQEFEDLLRTQRAADESVRENAKDLEARLRREIEQQVRQELLKQLPKSEDVAEARWGSQTPSTSTNETARTDSAPKSAHVPSQPAEPAIANDFGEEALEIFRMEAEEHMQVISIQVAALQENATDRDSVQHIRRATHTLKGAAGMMGYRAIADLSHIFEDLLDTVMEGSMAITPAVLSIILDTAETLDILVSHNDGDVSHGEAKARALQSRYADLLGERSSARDANEIVDVDLEAAIAPHIYDTSHATPNVSSEQAAFGEVNVPRAMRNDLAVRVRLQRLDELVNLFGELLVSRSVLEERLQRLIHLVSDVGVSSNRLRDVGQKLESRFEAATLPSGRSVQVMPGEGNQKPGASSGMRNGKNGTVPAHLAEFDELELDRYTEFHQLARGLSEGISDMVTLSAEMDTLIRETEGVFAREGRLSTTFQDRLMKTRLVPLSQLMPRLYQAARAVAIKQGKEVEFLREGETTEVDRTVFEEISGPLLHLVRNAVNHAIETPDIRRRKGKSPQGMVKLSAKYEGNQIVISVTDDGKGLDREHIRHTAIARGLIRPDQQLTEKDLVSFIFTPGFSTADVLSEESGRGVGLDVVGDAVSRLRGSIIVESMPDRGTTFTMIFPTSLAIQRAMMVRVSGQQFVIPTVHVESIGRFDNFKHVTITGQPAVMVRNEPYPLLILAQYLSLPQPRTIDEKAQLILVNAGGHRVALVVDAILGQADIVMKNLGPHLRQVHGIAGATVLGNGQVVLVLELNSLLSSPLSGVAHIGVVTPTARGTTVVADANGIVKYQRDISSPSWPGLADLSTPSPSANVAERGKHILVVDDSPSVRRVVGNMLKQHNWEIQMARDGVEALEMISHETPAAVLLDIEMPRMDGYELISTVRAQEQYRTLPMVVLTSRAAAKHQQRAMSLGASAYVVKPYQDEELLNILKSLIYGTATAGAR